MLNGNWSCVFTNVAEIMKLIISYLCGFTFAFLLFYIFGRLTWNHYGYFLILAAEILTIPFLVNGLVQKNKRGVH
jgi:hypothetical protein